jgi:hypothetical protein
MATKMATWLASVNEAGSSRILTGDSSGMINADGRQHGGQDQKVKTFSVHDVPPDA